MCNIFAALSDSLGRTNLTGAESHPGAVMSEVLVPPHAGYVELRFEPFSSSHAALIFMVAAALGLVGGVFTLYRCQRQRVN